MNDTKHKTNNTSTNCTACREWDRDMKGTLAVLQRERQATKKLLDSLQEVVRICEALRNTAGLGKTQLERIERAKTAITEATGRAV
jgi:hypothetical protein